MSENYKHTTLELKAKSLHEYYKRAMSELHKKVAKRWQEQGEIVHIEQLFPNDKPKQNAYSVDMVLPDYLAIIEIDGDCHIGRETRDSIRDQHIMSIALGTGIEWRIKRIPVSIPQNLLYGQLQGREREQVKAQYINWLNKLADDSLAMIKQEYLARKLQKLKKS